ncbi:hypothetical protein D3C86_411280 [compost metagenome]
MIRLTHSLPFVLISALGLGIIGCTISPPPGIGTQMPTRTGSASLTLLPSVSEGRLTQAVINRPTSASIARLAVIPMVETSPGQFQPFRADGTPTAPGDTQAVSVSQSAPTLKLTRSIQLTGLAPNTRYRILARAYDAQDNLISKDDASTVGVTVTDDDAPTATAIPVVLADVPFAARTTVTLTNGTNSDYETIVTSLVMVSGSVETPVPGTTQTFAKAQMPLTLTLDGLTADTTYRLKVSMRDGGNNEVAMASVEIAVSNDDAPAAKTLTLNV